MTSQNTNSEISLFKNSQLLGSFGEYCYKKFVTDKGFRIQKVGILEYDYLVEDEFKIDVKTTLSQKNYYSGVRVRTDICYDLISVDENTVSIFPDINSPIIIYKGEKIGGRDALYQEWMLIKKDRNKKVGTANIHKDKRNLISNEIKKSYPTGNIRVVFRGSVSNTRWSSLPDNLPGTTSILTKFDATVFAQMLTKDSSEQIAKLYLFKHSDIPMIAMKTPDSRQRKKGIVEVIDLDWYVENFKSHIYSNLDELKNGLQKFL